MPRPNAKQAQIQPLPQIITVKKKKLISGFFFSVLWLQTVQVYQGQRIEKGRKEESKTDEKEEVD